MPRSKNPKPLQVQYHFQDDREERCLSTFSNDVEEYADSIEHPSSISPPSISPKIKEETNGGDSILSVEGGDYNKEYAVDNEPVQAQKTLQYDSSPYNQVPDSFADKKRTVQQNEEVLDYTSTSGKKARRISMGLLNETILEWFRTRFTMKERAATSASQIIKLYEKELEEELNAPLQSYQVGQLLRRVYPNIRRCKITVNGKRVWVYRHLCIKDDYTCPSKMDSPNDSQNFEKKGVGTGDKLRRGIKDGEASRSTIKHLTLPEPRNVHKSVKNSAMLYNLLYTHQETSATDHQSKESNGDSSLVGVAKVADFNAENGEALPKIFHRDENVIQWLRDNYEYADGYYVKSLDVLNKYNHGRETLIKYLSQVGRVIKYVFPNARHLRRSLKGGKREWVYHNIRPKDYTEKDLWRGSSKNLARDEVLLKLDSRPSLVAFAPFSENRNSKSIENGRELFSKQRDLHNETKDFLERDSVASRGLTLKETESPESEDDRFFNRNSSARSTPTSNLLAICYKTGDENSELDKQCVNNEESSSWVSNSQVELGDVFAAQAQTSTKEITKTTPKTVIVKQEISPNSTSSSYHFPINVDTPTDHRGEETYAHTSNSLDEAEDLTVSSREQEHSAKKRPYNESSGSDGCSSTYIVKKQPKMNSNHYADENTDVPKLVKSRNSSIDHNYSSMPFNPEPRIKDAPKSKPSSQQPGNDLRCKKRQQGNFYHDSNLSKRSQGNLNRPSSGSTSSNRIGELLQWEDLSLCGAHRYGWTLTPTLNNDIPCNFIEWILFEGQLLRDGQRVFRELKIYDDWSVSIYAMGKKVFPDDLGGIIDLMRTKESVTKVFATLASAKSCRGLPALCLSDLCVRGVIVAKAEIWSSREDEGEDLRHRAINCQVLYQGSDEACQKCIRVIRMHSQNIAAAMGSNGFSEKTSPHVTSRPSSLY